MPVLSKLYTTGLPALLEDGLSIPFMVISPQVRTTWNGKGSELDAFLDFLLLRYPRIDPERVYLTGISDGGKGVFDFAMYHRDRVAAIIPVSTWPSDGASVPLPREPFAASPGMPIWGFMGNADSYHAMDAWLTALASESSAEIRFMLMDGGHNGSVWNTVFAGSSHAIYDWLLSHRRPQATTGVRPSAEIPEIIALETFQFAQTPVSLQNQSGTGSIGWNGNWIQAQTSSQPAAQVSAHRHLGTILGKRGGVWISVEIHPSATAAASQIGFSLTDDLRHEGVFVGLTENREDWTLRGDAVKSTVITLENLKVNAISRLVIWLDFGRNEGRLWLDPDVNGDAPAGDGVPFDLFPGRQFDRIVLHAPEGPYPSHVIQWLSIASTFQLTQYSTQYWAGWPLVPPGFVNTDDPSPFLGWIQVSSAPFVYVQTLGSWIYLPESFVEQSGSWSYIFQKQ